MKLSSVTALIASLSIPILCVGCKDEPELAAPSPATQSEAAVASPAAPVAVTPPPGELAAPAPMAGGVVATAEVEVPSKDALEAVTLATQSFFVANQRAPRTLEELVSSGYLRKLPAPPAGKKYVYNAETANISLADQ